MKKAPLLAIAFFVTELAVHNAHALGKISGRYCNTGFFRGALRGALVTGPMYGNYYAPYVYGYTPYIYNYYAPVYWSPSAAGYWY